MPKRSTEAAAISAADYQAILARHNFRQSDGAWICDVSTRMGANYALHGVTGAPAILIMAVDEGLISLEWLTTKIKRAIP